MLKSSNGHIIAFIITFNLINLTGIIAHLQLIWLRLLTTCHIIVLLEVVNKLSILRLLLVLLLLLSIWIERWHHHSLSILMIRPILLLKVLIGRLLILRITLLRVIIAHIIVVTFKIMIVVVVAILLHVVKLFVSSMRVELVLLVMMLN